MDKSGTIGPIMDKSGTIGPIMDKSGTLVTKSGRFALRSVLFRTWYGKHYHIELEVSQLVDEETMRAMHRHPASQVWRRAPQASTLAGVRDIWIVTTLAHNSEVKVAKLSALTERQTACILPA